MAHQVKKENYSENRLTKLTFTTKYLSNLPVWTKDGKEFCYKNEMYDVVKIFSNKDSISYYCIKDRAENSLLESFLSLLINSLGNDKKNQNDYSKELSKYNFAVNNDPGIIKFINIIYPARTSFYKSLNKQIDYPPPKFA
jgi:hypothetical protein